MSRSAQITTTHPSTVHATAAPTIERVVPKTSARSLTYEARLAISEETKRDAYRVRYRSYLAGGHIEPNDAKLFKDRYDDMPNASTVVIYDAGRPVASVRTCLLARGSDLASPALDTFPDQVRRLLDAKPHSAFAGRGIEVTRLVRSPEAENNQGLVFLLYRMAGYVALCAHSQIHLACVRTNHAPFYRRLGYEPASEPQPYPGLMCKMQLMASDRVRYDKVRAAVPLMDPLAGMTHNLNEFFLGEPIILSLTR
jgi:hypothetical protein